MCTNLIKLGNQEAFDKIINFLLIEIIKKIKTYNSKPDSHNFFLIKNYIIFFMIITINLKNFSLYVKKIYIGKKPFFISVFIICTSTKIFCRKK